MTAPQQKHRKNKIIVLCGIPTSGKSTWAAMYARFNSGYHIVSRDQIRLNLGGKNYKQTNFNERTVTRLFNTAVKLHLIKGHNVILDNCHCKDKYIQEIIKKYPHDDVAIKFFDMPLWKALYRNFIRGIAINKWIPVKVLRTMHKNYKGMNHQLFEPYKMT